MGVTKAAPSAVGTQALTPEAIAPLAVASSRPIATHAPMYKPGRPRGASNTFIPQHLHISLAGRPMCRPPARLKHQSHPLATSMPSCYKLGPRRRDRSRRLLPLSEVLSQAAINAKGPV